MSRLQKTDEHELENPALLTGINQQIAWNRLTPLWVGGKQIIEDGVQPEELAPAWQILIFGDISPTRHLKLLTGEQTEVDLIDTSIIGMDPDGVPELIHEVPGPRLRRQVWLRTVSGQRLAYAVSWWEAEKADGFLQTKSKPIWTNLSNLRTELYRELQMVQYGNSAPLEEAFEQEGPFWGRYYYFYHQKKALTLIFEVFSPFLSKYLGLCRSFPYPI
jgi:chorismate lyase